MMKNGFQRGISLLTVMMMLISSMPVGVLAEDVIDSNEVTVNQESLETKSIETSTNDTENLTSNEPIQTTEYESFQYQEEQDGITIISFKGVLNKIKSLEIPAQINGKTMVKIGEGAFKGNTEIKEVVIPKGITAINETAFNGCTGLEKITVSKDNTTYYDKDGKLYLRGTDKLVLEPYNWQEAAIASSNLEVALELAEDVNQDQKNQALVQGSPNTNQISLTEDNDNSINDQSQRMETQISTQGLDVMQLMINNSSIGSAGQSYNVLKGNEISLSVTRNSLDAQWRIDNSNIAGITSTGRSTIQFGSYIQTVYSVTLQGLKTGSTNISLIENGYVVSTAIINVSTPVMGITLSKDNTEINLGNSEHIAASITPLDADNQTINWSSVNQDIATVDNQGTILAVGEGNTVISAVTEDGSYTASCSVNVVIPVTEITLDKVSINFSDRAATQKLTATVAPENATDKGIIWESSDMSVASVDSNGNVKAVGNGTATITAKNLSGEFNSECIVNVDGLVQEITLNNDSILITQLGNTAVLEALIMPLKAQNKTVIWTTNNAEVATVDATGKVTARGNGTASIMATTVDGGKTASCIVLVPLDLSVKYRTHVQDYGWQGYVSNGTMSGTSGESKRLEAIKIGLTGKDADRYDIYYRVHAQDYGWLDWAMNGEAAGTEGLSKRLEGIEIKIVLKGTDSGLVTDRPFVSSFGTGSISYRTHVQDYGWQDYVNDGVMSGTSGKAKRLEGINIRLGADMPSGSVVYSTHVQDYGWMQQVSDGAMSGTSGEAKRLEAIRINLTDETANQYDIYYRVHAQNIGWLDWAKNGQDAGTGGFSYRLEGIEIKLVAKGGKAPGSTVRPFIGSSSYFIDTHPPVVESISLDRNIIKVGDQVQITAIITDDLSGVNTVTANVKKIVGQSLIK